MNTLIVVAFHQIIYNGLAVIIDEFITMSFLSGIIRLLLSFVVLTYLCRFINKYMPVVLGR